MRRGGAVPRSCVLGLVSLIVAAVAMASGPQAPDRPAAVGKLLTLLMTNPTEKHDDDPDRISYILKIGDFKVPAEPGATIEDGDPKTWVLQRASTALVDRSPFALAPAQIGPEDTLSVQVFNARTGHTVWSIHDKGAKGPGESGTKGRIPLFGRDNNEVYRDYLERILATLKVSAQGKK